MLGSLIYLTVRYGEEVQKEKSKKSFVTYMPFVFQLLTTKESKGT